MGARLDVRDPAVGVDASASDGEVVAAAARAVEFNVYKPAEEGDIGKRWPGEGGCCVNKLSCCGRRGRYLQGERGVGGFDVDACEGDWRGEQVAVPGVGCGHRVYAEAEGRGGHGAGRKCGAIEG